MIVSDRGTSFSGPDWDALCGVHDVVRSAAARDAHFQVGLVGRQVHLLKLGFSALSRPNTRKLPRQDLTAMACIARNTTPLSGCPYSPSLLVSGREDFLSRLVSVAIPSKSATSNVDQSAQNMRGNLDKIIQLRGEFARWGDQCLVKTALNRNLRIGSSYSYQPMDAAQEWNAKDKIWNGRYRILTGTGRSAIVERGKIEKSADAVG